MGRVKSDIWIHFTEVKVGDVVRARCKGCDHEMVNNAERMKSHWASCSKKNDTSEGPSAPKQPRLTQSTLSIPTNSHKKEDEINMLIAKFIIGTNSPFLHVENKNFCRLVDALRPGTKIPNRRTLAGPLLDKLFEQEKNKIERLVKGQVCTMIIDGWSTKMMEPVIGVAINVVGKGYLFDTLDTTGQPHTSDYLIDLCKNHIAKIENEWGVRVSSVVTDNASNMAGFRRMIKDPSALLHTYGCQAHHMNLLAKEIGSKMKVPIEKIVKVVKHLRNHHAESALLRQHELPRPPLPVETRWNSLTDTLKYFVDHWSTLVVVINTIMKPTDPIYRSMEDVQLKRTASELLEIFNPLSTSLDTAQSDSSTLSECLELWFNLRMKVPEQFAQEMSHRYNKAVLDTPVMRAANLLDHRYVGQNLDSQENAKALAYLKEINESIIPEVMKYISKVPPYSQHYFEGTFKDADPVSWWTSGLRLGFDKTLSDIAVSLVSCTSSSGGIERCFSTLGATYGKLRTSMGVEKAGKLAFLYRQLNLD